MSKLKEFGVTLRDFRVRLPGRGRKGILSQSELAERAGFDHTHVNRLEGGGRHPTYDAVERLGKALGLELIELEELMFSAGFVPPHIFEALVSEPIVREILRLLQDEALPVSTRESMLDVLSMVASNARSAISSDAGLGELAA